MLRVVFKFFNSLQKVKCPILKDKKKIVKDLQWNLSIVLENKIFDSKELHSIEERIIFIINLSRNKMFSKKRKLHVSIEKISSLDN